MATRTRKDPAEAVARAERAAANAERQADEARREADESRSAARTARGGAKASGRAAARSTSAARASGGAAKKSTTAARTSGRAAAKSTTAARTSGRAAAKSTTAARTSDREAAEAEAAARASARQAAQAADDAAAAEGAARSSRADSAKAEGAARSSQADSAKAAAAAALAEDAVADDDPLLDTAVRQIEAGVTDDKPFGELGEPIAPRSPFRIAFFAALGVAAAYYLVQAVLAARQVLILLVIAAFLAIGLNPAVEALQRRGLTRSRAVGVVVTGVLAFFVAFGFAVVPPIAEQAGQFVDDLPNRIATLQENPTVRDLDRRFGVLEQARRSAAEMDARQGVRAIGGVLGVGRVVLSTTFSVLTVLILTLYFLASYPNVKRSAYRLVPRSRRARVGLLTDEILSRVGGYVAGALTIAAIAGVTSAIFLGLVGVPFAIAIAMVIALLDLIPLVGATIGATVASLVGFTVSPRVGLITVAFYIAYQQIENYVIYPRVMRRSVDVSPAATIVAILVGAALLGILGALLAIPTAAAIQLIGSEVLVPRQDST